MNILPPACRHRGLKCGADRWVCGSPKLVIPGGVVSARDCSEVCPFVDHPPGADSVASGWGAGAHAGAGGFEPSEARDRIISSSTGSWDVAVAVITAPRVVSMLERTISELRRAGFSQTVRVFSEPGSVVPDLPDVVTSWNVSPLGAWGNWLRAARALLDETESSHLLICQDDIALAACARLALDHAIRTLPASDWGYASLYTPVHHLVDPGSSAGDGWRAIELTDRGYWGALAYCFTRASLREALRHGAVLEHRGDREIDVVISRALRALGKRLYFHLPSLADHTGKGISSLGHAPLRGSLAASFSATYCRYTPRVSARTDDERGEPRVTVVVATYNCADYLADCLRSLVGQSAACEIIVVDDGSRDDTRGVLRAFEGIVRTIGHEENQGARAARATGLREARSEWVVMADADAVYDPDYLETLLAAADRRSSVVYCSWLRQVSGTAGGEVVHARPFNAEELWWDNRVSMSSLVRRSVVPEFDGVSDDLDDWSLWLELASRGCQFQPVDRVLFRALERPEGKTAGLRRDPRRYRREVARLRREYARLIGFDGRISVIVPARDCLDLTEQCLTHLAWFSGLPIQVIYVDNASASEVPARVASLAESLGLPLATILNSSNYGFTPAVNRGLRFAEGRHVLCLNNDCFIGPDCVERLYWHMTRTGRRVAAVGPLTGDDGGQSIRQPDRRRRAGISDHRDIDYDDPLAGARIVQGPFRSRAAAMVAFFCTLLNRDALKEIGPLDEITPEFGAGLGVDDEWCLRAARRGWTVLMALDAYAAHLGHQSFQRLGVDREALRHPALAVLRERAASDPDSLAFTAEGEGPT